MLYFSTDVGNVSQLVPAIQPMVSIAPPAVMIHTPGFAKAAATPVALNAMLAAAKAMAMTAIDLLAKTGNLEKVHEEFRSTIKDV